MKPTLDKYFFCTGWFYQFSSKLFSLFILIRLVVILKGIYCQYTETEQTTTHTAKNATAELLQVICIVLPSYGWDWTKERDNKPMKILHNISYWNWPLFPTVSPSARNNPWILEGLRHRLVASCQFYTLVATCQQLATNLSILPSCIKSVIIRFVATCYLHTCYSLRSRR